MTVTKFISEASLEDLSVQRKTAESERKGLYKYETSAKTHEDDMKDSVPVQLAVPVAPII